VDCPRPPSELADIAVPDDHQNAIELERLQAKEQEIEQALYRQSLRMEEHDDPHHPVVALAKQRIDELSVRRGAIHDAIRATEAKQTNTFKLDQIEATLERIPDLRPTLKTAGPDELAEILEAFDITATYDKDKQALALAATINPEFTAALDENRPPDWRSGKSSIAGAGSVLISPTQRVGRMYHVVEVRELR